MSFFFKYESKMILQTVCFATSRLQRAKVLVVTFDILINYNYMN